MGGRADRTGAVVVRRYPFAPLAEAMSCSEHAACVRLGLSGSTQQEYRRRGVSLDVAERLALRAGLHPFEVWPSMPEDRRRDQWAAYARRRWETDPAHRARRQAYMRQYRTDAARVLAAQKQAWVEANRDKVRVKNREAMRRYRARKKAEAA